MEKETRNYRNSQTKHCLLTRVLTISIKMKNVLLLTHWSFNDPLIQTYTLPYVNFIRQYLSKTNRLTVVTYEQHNIALNKVQLDSINKMWSSHNMELITFSYNKFGLKKLINAILDILKLTYLIRRHNISYLHAFCMPAGVYASILSHLTGALLIIDSFEPHAEVMLESGTWKKSSLAYKLLWNLEKLAVRRCSIFIGTTASMKNYAYNKYLVNISQFYVKPACVDLSKVKPKKKNNNLLIKYGLNDKIVCVYAGKLGGIYLVEEVFYFIRECYEFWGEKFRFLMLTITRQDEILLHTRKLNIPDQVVVSFYCDHDKISDYLNLADFAINPVKPIPSRRYATSIKDAEYWAVGLPIVIPAGISDDSDIILQNNAGYVLNELSKNEYINAINKISKLLEEPKENLKTRISNIAKMNRDFNLYKNIYSSIYK